MAESSINFNKVKNGYVITKSEEKNGKWKSDTYVAKSATEAKELMEKLAPKLA
jgi:hypothetical protein